MSKIKDEALQKYKKECFKQTRPYQFEMAYLDEGGRPEGTPPNSDSGTIIFFPNDSENVLNFEGINTEYLIFVSREGIAEKDMPSILLSDSKNADIIYCDEDFASDISADLSDMNVRIRNLRTPWRKPEYSPDTLLSFPYIETVFAIRTAFARTVPVLRKSPEISDAVRVWDFLLRACERTNRIKHISSVLFHRDLDALIDSSQQIVTDEDIYEALYMKYQRPGYKLCREAAQRRRGFFEYNESAITEKGAKPVVSVIIPSKDQPEMLKDCIRYVRINAGAVPIEIIIVDNGSSEDNKARIQHIIENTPGNIIRYIYDPFEFDFSRMCNIGASEAKGAYLLFLNDDVETNCDRFLEKMLAYARMPHIGAVGAKLLYPEGNAIQHVGIADINKGPTHKLMTMSDDRVRYYCRNRFVWNVLAVTGACLLVEREKYFQVGGFSDKMKVGYNDVDLCVKLYENGYFNVVINEFSLVHKESVSRGSDSIDDAKNARLVAERNNFYAAHYWLKSAFDPFYGNCLDRDTIEYKSFVVPEYQQTDLRNKAKKYNKLPARVSDKLRFAIDRTQIERGIGEGSSDAYLFDGWVIDEHSDNAFVKKYMVLVPIDENGDRSKECIIASVSPKYRSDLSEVFPEAVNVSLSGFECRIPMDIIDRDCKYVLGVCTKKIGRFGGYKLSLGDTYEPGRGIITDK